MSRLRKWWIVLGSAASLVLLLLVMSIERGQAPGIVLFVGRFHPTVVHFPIALLLLGALLEAAAPYSERVARMRSAVPFIWLLGAFSALAAVVLGYLLSLGGGYEEGLLTWHMRLGLFLTAGAFGLAAASSRIQQGNRVYRGAVFGMAFLVLAAGHLGGTLTRGSGYLTQYMPAPIKTLVGLEAGRAGSLIVNVDSARVYADIVAPILERRCVKCHGASKSKGDLRLDSPDAIVEGGRDGIILVAGNPGRSEIVRRITLPSFDEDVMPPAGEAPLDVGETEVIRWWIENGASFDLRVADAAEMSSAVETYIARISAPRQQELSGIYALKIPEPDSVAVKELLVRGLSVTRLAPDAPFISVTATGVRDAFADDDLASLRPLSQQIARLDLGFSKVTDAGLEVIAEMPHLTHLHLQHTGVTDDGMKHLEGFTYLECLNLYGAAVGDDGLQHLSSLEELRRVYLWQTEVTPSGAEKLKRSHPGLEINLGSTLALVEPDSVETI